VNTQTHRIKLHACPRCHGDLFPDEDDFACLQCGGHFILAKAKAQTVAETRRSAVELPQEAKHAAA